jgi:hypothetical protein
MPLPIETSLVEPEPSGYQKDVVDKLAEKVAEKLHFQPGDSIEDIVKKLGGKLEYLSMEDWLADLHGAIEVRARENFTVYVSNFTGPLRNRFTIAHELGHYFLHSKFGEKPIKVGRNGTSTRVEWEANWFAGGFLMPKKEFKKAFEEDSNSTALAAKFLVSTAAVEVRIDSLELNRK